MSVCGRMFLFHIFLPIGNDDLSSVYISTCDLCFSTSMIEKNNHIQEKKGCIEYICFLVNTLSDCSSSIFSTVHTQRDRERNKRRKSYLRERERKKNRILVR